MNPRPAPLLERALDDETYYLNMGPQHPSMHGVLRLLLHLRGELILSCEPVIGYAHRAHEKMAENRSGSSSSPTRRASITCPA